MLEDSWSHVHSAHLNIFHSLYFAIKNQITSHKHQEPIEVVTVTTGLTLWISCPKTVYLLNKAHQHEGQAALGLLYLTFMNDCFDGYLTQSNRKHNSLSSTTETSRLSLDDQNAVQRRMSTRFEVTPRVSAPLESPSSSLQLVCSLTAHLALCKGHDVSLIFWLLKRRTSECSSLNATRQLSFIWAIRPVPASVRV